MTHFARQFGCATALAIASTFAAFPAWAGDIVTEWASVKPPPAPQLKPVTVDPKTTALLVLDFMKNNCGARPRCVATVPAVKKLIDAARANGMMIAYILTGQNPKYEDMIDQSLDQRAGGHLNQHGRGDNQW